MATLSYLERVAGDYIMNEQKTYTIKRHARSRRVTISIHGDGRVVVTAPRRIAESVIHAFVVQKETWIETTRQKQREKRKYIIPSNTVQPSYDACKARAKQFLKLRVEEINTHYQFEYARISVKDLKSRWGSCSSKKNLNFHYKLLFLPLDLVDYVVVHELCHLKEMNHSEKFWTLVSEIVPDYKKKREEINKYLL